MPAKKTETAKKEVKATPIKKEAVSATSKTAIKKAGGLSVIVYSLLGKATGSLDLPKEIFGSEINFNLLSQAVRVYTNNEKAHHSNTKTRGEVTGSTRKIFKQKGTGRARHGAITAPIFVGGGIALGPKYRKVTLDLPKKMKNKALISALAQKVKEEKVLAVTGLDKASGKTKEIAQFIKTVLPEKGNALVITGEKMDSVVRASNNIKGLDVLPAELVNVFEVVKHQKLVLTNEAVEKLQQRLASKGK